MENIENIKIKIFSHQTEFWWKRKENSKTNKYKLREWTIGELAEEWTEFLSEDVNEYFKKSAQECIKTGDLEHFLKKGHETIIIQRGDYTIDTNYNIWIFPSLVE